MTVADLHRSLSEQLISISRRVEALEDGRGPPELFCASTLRKGLRFPSLARVTRPDIQNVAPPHIDRRNTSCAHARLVEGEHVVVAIAAHGPGVRVGDPRRRYTNSDA